YTMHDCVYSTSDYSDMVYLNSYSFNQVVDLQFNSSVGKFVGYTEQGVKFAENFNKDPAILQQLKARPDTFCRHNAQIWDSAVRDKSGECYRTLLSAVLFSNDLLSCEFTCAEETH
uniref:MHC class II beta chain N-terminal domain-containing protein n=1 Tax=Cyprinus carpio TaxID=7962 RepID=A0A8C2EMA2_CYPCA